MKKIIISLLMFASFMTFAQEKDDMYFNHFNLGTILSKVFNSSKYIFNIGIR